MSSTGRLPAQRPCRLVVFDLAGTTVQDDGHVAAAFETALREHGVAITADQLAGLRGMSKREAVRRLVPEGPDRARRAEAAYAAFVGHLTSAYRRYGVQPIAGADDVFRRLRAGGIRVVLNTGFDREVTDLLLTALGWRTGRVDGIVCGDDVAHGRPAPDLIFAAMAASHITTAEAVANVGDTASDLQAGHQAGVRWNVGVLSGAHDRARLEAAPHTHLIASVAEFPRVLEADVSV